MTDRLSERVWRILTCPSCGGSLVRVDPGARCPECDAGYTRSSAGQLDLRLQRPKRCAIELELGTELPADALHPETLRSNPAPEVDFHGIQVPSHLTAPLLSHFPRAKRPDSLMLDLGCGNTVHRRVCEQAGFEYVGMDIDAPEAPLLADAHALPFRDDTIEFVLSIAVLEHIRYPFVMLREVHRVLQPGGKLIGTVSFLEPFHGNSFYHHTHLGTWNSLHTAGFHIEQIAPSKEWSVLVAQATMGLFPRLPRAFSRPLVMPLHLLHRLWWRLGFLISRSASATEARRVLSTTGAFTFIAAKL